MELFSGNPLSQLKFEDLRQELTTKEVAEGFYVDYKADFPDKLHKYVASFANSHGGYIFIGIKEDSLKKTAAAFDGIPLDSDQSERARNLIHAHVSPFPPVEIATVEVPSSERRGIVVIRIPESSVAPHVCSDGVVYTRNGDSSEPVKDRFSLDRLYDKSRRMGDALTERLAKTITMGRIYPETNWDQPAPSESIVLAILVYPVSLASWNFAPFDRGLLRTAATNILSCSCNFRSLRDGVAAVSGASNKHISPEWWKLRELGIAYEDGLIEHVQRLDKRPEMFRLRDYLMEALNDAFKHARRLECRHVCVGPVVGEIHILGVWGVRFSITSQPFPRASCQCDHGIVTYRFEIAPTILQNEAEWNDKHGPKLADEIFDTLVDEAGGEDHLL